MKPKTLQTLYKSSYSRICTQK